MSIKSYAIVCGIATSAFAVNVAHSAVIVPFDNNNESNPFRYTAVRGTTEFSGSVTDPDFNEGTSVTLTFSHPVKGVGITTPSSPDFSNTTDSFFGAESSGFGVGDTNLGRFDRGEAFTLHTTHAMTINSFLFHEWNGDEDLHSSWTQNGVPKSGVFPMTMSSGTAPANVLVNLSGLTIDANTDVVITNVSPSNANTNARLRIRQMEIALVPEPASLSLLGLGGLALLRRRRAV